MNPFRPTSYDRPGEQISTTPSGLKVTSAKRLMVDSMVRMIQKAENHSVEDKLDEESKIINQFIDKSLGEWKSIRSTHTLDFQEFENSTSKIYIKHINLKNKKVVEIFKNYRLSLNLESISISIKWQAISDWEDDDMSEGDETILIFLP